MGKSQKNTYAYGSMSGFMYEKHQLCVSEGDKGRLWNQGSVHVHP